MADQQHASSTSGDPAKMPDGFAAGVGSLTGNKGLLGQNPGAPKSRQDIPGSGDITPREQYDFTSGGKKALLGQDTTSEGSMSDPTRPTLPDPALAGESGTTNMGPQGSPLDFNTVAPYKYPEFPQSAQRNEGDPTAHLAE